MIIIVRYLHAVEIHALGMQRLNAVVEQNAKPIAIFMCSFILFRLFCDSTGIVSLINKFSETY